MSRSQLKIFIVAGARPNFMKVAPIIQHIVRRSGGNAGDSPRIIYRLIHTGQHYDTAMSTVFFQDLGIPSPDVDLGVGSGTHAIQTANIMSRFEPVCEQERPDWVVVVGDVNSTMACTLVCAKLGIKVAHVEAGLRSFDRSMPEEVNRIVTDSLADLLLTPSADAGENLAREGVAANKVRFVGNVMIDSLLANIERAHASSILKQYDLTKEQFVYVTLHRPSNVDFEEGLAAVMSELQRVAEHMPVIFPMHPRTRKMAEKFGISLNGRKVLHIIEPIGYHDSLCLTESAKFIVTDSGGLQEESTFFRTPCLTLRPNTERPVTIDMGSNRLTTPERLSSDVDAYLNLTTRTGMVPPLWDGRTAERIVKSILDAS